MEYVEYMGYPVLADLNVTRGCVEHSVRADKQCIIMHPDDLKRLRSHMKGQVLIPDDRVAIAQKRLLQIIHGEKCGSSEADEG